MSRKTAAAPVDVRIGGCRGLGGVCHWARFRYDDLCRCVQAGGNYSGPTIKPERAIHKEIRMNVWKLAMALLAFCLFSAAGSALAAQGDVEVAPEKKVKKAGGEKKSGDEKKVEKKAADEDEESEGVANMRRAFKGLDDVTGKVTFTAEDIKNLIDHWDELDAIIKEGVDDDDNKSFKDVYEDVIKNEGYLRWAAQNEFQPQAFIRKSLRIMSSIIRNQVNESLDIGEKQMEKGIEALEARKETMSEEQYKKEKAQADKEVAEAKKNLVALRKVLKDMPENTDDETKLLKKHKEELAKMMSESDEDEDDEEDDEDEDEDEEDAMD